MSSPKENTEKNPKLTYSFTFLCQTAAIVATFKVIGIILGDNRGLSSLTCSKKNHSKVISAVGYCTTGKSQVFKCSLQ